MEITIKRIARKPFYTIGKMYINGEYLCDTLENPCRDVKVIGQTAIPTGKYEVRLSVSNRFKRLLPEILNVPDFTGIRIHRGNTCMDTEGCILLGENKIVGAVINSTYYEEKLIKMLKESKEVRHNLLIS